jgi:Sortase domain
VGGRLAALVFLAGAGVLAGVPAWWAASRPEPAAGSLAPLAAAQPAVQGELRERRPLARAAGTARSARIDALRPARRAAPPSRIEIPSLGVRARVLAAGVDRAGALRLPGASRTAWYRFGSAPGEPGSTVIAGHVDLAGAPGAFRRLGELEPGRLVVVRTTDGRAYRYRVVARRAYAKERLPTRVWTRAGRPVLTLVTCGGDYDEEARSYAANTVVYAVAAG